MTFTEMRLMFKVYILGMPEDKLGAVNDILLALRTAIREVEAEKPTQKEGE